MDNPIRAIRPNSSGIEIPNGRDNPLSTSDDNVADTNTPPLFRQSNLEDVRKRLLDLTASSPLLNYKYPAKKSLRLVDASVDRLHAQVSCGQSINLLPVPEPKAEQLIDAGYGKHLTVEYPGSSEWARYLEIPTSYEFVSDGDTLRTSTAAQSLLFAEDLETRLKVIGKEATTSLEERGANTLFLAIGFLEWYEKKTSDTARRAPLIVLPVKLERKSTSRLGGKRAYSITGTGEDLFSNLTLAEKLRLDFGVEFPGLPELGEHEDDGSIEEWFKQVEDVVQKHDVRWRVSRSAVLGLWDFAKQAMYLDLDPKRWASSSPLTSHPVVKTLFSDAENTSEYTDVASYGTEYLIDELEAVHTRFPLISDADSSQHSAVVDAVNGKNLVIEGPPGTGKSQTITNLIAACISSGKKVLFVAEKMDALDVVARRLETAGLDGLCLELHSDKANKSDVLNSIVSASVNRKNAASPSDLNSQRNRYETLRKQLQAVAVEMNTPWGSSELTPHEILHRAREFADRTELPEVEIKDVNPATLSATSIAELLDSAELLTLAATQVASQAQDGKLESHLWFGFGGTDSEPQDKRAFLDCLRRWNDALITISGLLHSLSSELGDSASDELSEMTTLCLAQDLGQLPADVSETLLLRIDDFAAHEGGLNTLLGQYRKLKQTFDVLGKNIRPEALMSPIAENNLRVATDQILDEFGMAATNTSLDVEQSLKSVSTLMALAVDIREEVSLFDASLPSTLKPALGQRGNTWYALRLTLDSVGLLPVTLHNKRSNRLEDSVAQERVEAIAAYIQTINALAEPLSELFDLDTVPDLAKLQDWQKAINTAGRIGFVKPAVRRARACLRSCAASGSINVKALESALPDLREYRKQIISMDKLEQDDPVLGPLYRGLETPVEQLRLLVDWYKHLSKRYGKGNSSKALFGKAIRDLDVESLRVLQDAIDNGLAERLDEAHRQFSGIKAVFTKFAQSLPSQVALCPAIDPTDDDTGSGQEILTLASTLQSALESIHHATIDPSLPLEAVRSTAINWRDALHQTELWKTGETASLFSSTVSELPLPGKLEEISVGERELETSLKLAVIANSSPILVKAYQQADPRLVHAKLVEKRDELIDSCQEAGTARELLIELGQMNMEHCFIQPQQSLRYAISQNTQRLDNLGWLDAWQSWERVKHRQASKHLGQVAFSIQSGHLKLTDVRDSIESSLYRELATFLLANTPSISGIEGLEQNGLREQFRRTDRELILLQRQQIAYNAAQTALPSGSAQGLVGSYTEMALVQHEHSKKRGHIAIRSLLSRASGAITSLKPCFMMSPMSVAQYLEPGKFEFDLIVMDEASQILPEEAIGAIARAKQLVVVGDPKQLPPTSFFNKAAGESDDSDGDVAIQQSESILDAVMPLFQKRRLRWHYRSKHESLIDFSNTNFYDSNLVVFPSPAGASDEFGVKPERLNGTFQSQVNTIEAERIVDLLAEQLLHRPTETVGVVTMNAKQADLVEQKLETRSENDLSLKAAIDRFGTHGEKMFIKNLERVQGDERDVIIISMTYGPATVGGKTAQRFGPINSATGWRRLNVLLTRSRKRMHIITSMRATDVTLSNSSSLGVKSFRSLLEYCERGTTAGTVSHAGKAPDTDFERSIMRRLEEHGYSCVPQLGVAGYFLDLAVLDPEDPGRFLLAIECDGATYHAAKSARDRDRLRQDVLEGLGWKVHRIWSTDWFRAPDAQIAMVLKALESRQLKAA